MRGERLEIEIHADRAAACRAVAGRIADAIRGRAAAGRRYVLGLPTGSTPVPLYAELVRRHREDGLSFSNVVVFNLDEYYGLEPGDPRSYHAYMRRHLLDQVDLPPGQAHLPDGTRKRREVAAHCEEYEQAIREAGGIDLQILGLGHNGHIAFNEPGSDAGTRTRLVSLADETRADAADAFGGLERVPKEAITVGVATILEAREVVLMAWGRGKAEAVARALRDPVDRDFPVTFLRRHPAVTFVLDRDGAEHLEVAG